MDSVERRLTNPTLICDRLKELVSNGEDFILSIMEKHAHGESFANDEVTANAIITIINQVHNVETNKQLTRITLQYENLVQSVSLLIAENNAHLLQLFRAQH